MTQEKNGSDPVFTPDIRYSISLPFFPPKQYLSEEKQSFFKINGIGSLWIIPQKSQMKGLYKLPTGRCSIGVCTV
jgi:hypothetical protein